MVSVVKNQYTLYVKNRFIIQMLTHMANKMKIIINLVCLEKGHTQNINDTVIDRAKKGVNIHHPSQWITLFEKEKPLQSHSNGFERFL